MPTYVALTYTADVDWSAPEQAEEMAEYAAFGRAAAAIIRGGVPDGHGHHRPGAGRQGRRAGHQRRPLCRDQGRLTGFYLLDCADLDEAVAVAARMPAAWNGAVEVRPVIDLRAGGGGA
jgi:hypothetical protein